MTRPAKLLIAFLLCGSHALHAQLLHPESPRPSFEVVTIKPHDANSRFVSTPTGGRIFRMATTPHGLVAFAYHATSKQTILGVASWMDNTIYRIEATIPEDLFLKMKDMPPAGQLKITRLMMQSLLADRFKLDVHFGNQNMPVYVLLADKNGLKLPTPNDPSRSSGGSWAMSPRGEMIIRNAKLDELLSSPIFNLDDHPVVNDTGANGTYDLKLNWRRPATINPLNSAAATSPDEDQPSLSTALQEQFGIRIGRAQRSVETVSIDHMEAPSSN